MQVHKAFKFRLYPNKEQAEKLAKQFGCNRFVYNYFLSVRIKTYEETGKSLSYYDTTKLLTQLKREEGYSWLKEVSAQSLHGALINLDSAYSKFFKGLAQFPRFKSKHAKQSASFPQDFRFTDSHTRIPKIGLVKTKFSQPIAGKQKSITVSKTKSGKYYVSVLCLVDLPEPAPKHKEVGIDLGLKHFVVTSDGLKVETPKYLRKSEKKLKKLSRQLSRKKKGSANREKARKRLAVLHEKVANQRRDFHHKLAKELVDNYGLIALEDLAIKNMVKNGRLAKSINDAGWAQFVEFLTYKGSWYGTEVLKADRFFPSSKRHFACGWINENLKLSDRKWTCDNCGEEVDRDLNASLNILMYCTVGYTGT